MFFYPCLPNYIYKLKKVIYVLKQAPRTWHERLAKFIIMNAYVHVGINMALFVKNSARNTLIAQLYVDVIVFGGMPSKMVDYFVQ